MAETVTLEVVCGQCGTWWRRWTADLGLPFDEQRIIVVSRPGAMVATQSPGTYRPATDGEWYRWTPGPSAALPVGQFWTRYIFRCPNGCPTTPQARKDRLDAKGRTALRYLHDTRTPVLRTTVDKLLGS